MCAAATAAVLEQLLTFVCATAAAAVLMRLKTLVCAAAESVLVLLKTFAAAELV